MTSAPSVIDRLQFGDEIAVTEIMGRLDELESHFDDWGFSYIAINGWLIPSLDSNPEARELMALRGVRDHLGELSTEKVVFTSRENDDAGEFLCEMRGRYVPDGYLYSVPSAEAALSPGE